VFVNAVAFFLTFSVAGILHTTAADRLTPLWNTRSGDYSGFVTMNFLVREGMSENSLLSNEPLRLLEAALMPIARQSV
jgi:hypothetical protein